METPENVSPVHLDLAEPRTVPDKCRKSKPDRAGSLLLVFLSGALGGRRGPPAIHGYFRLSTGQGQSPATERQADLPKTFASTSGRNARSGEAGRPAGERTGTIYESDRERFDELFKKAERRGPDAVDSQNDQIRAMLRPDQVLYFNGCTPSTRPLAEIASGPTTPNSRGERGERSVS